MYKLTSISYIYSDNFKLFIIFVLCIEKKVEKMYTSARKQMLISSLPPVIILHLKRFHQVIDALFFLYIDFKSCIV